MPKYINAEGRIITASSKAYKLIYMEQGYKPMGENTPIGTKIPAQGQKTKDTPQILDRESLNAMEYADIKELAKQLEIPRYANTKKNELVDLILEKTDMQHGTRN